MVRFIFLRHWNVKMQPGAPAGHGPMRCVPDAHGAVGAGRTEPVAIGAGRQCVNWARVPVQFILEPTRVQLLIVEQQQLLEGTVTDFLLRVR